MKIMSILKNKKISLIVCLAAILAVACFVGCEKIEPPTAPTVTDSQSLVLATKAPEGLTSTEGATATEDATKAPSGDPTSAVTAEPTAAPTEAPIEAPVSWPPEGKYIDVSKIKRVYVNPDSTVTIDSSLVQSASGWTSSNTEVASLGEEGGRLTVTSSKTGMSKLTNSSTGETVWAYSIQPAERTEDNKVIEGIEYFLYYEKGNHVLTVYKADNEGYYTVPVKTISCASGTTPAKTPVGIHTLRGGESGRLRWKTFSASCHAQYGIYYANGVLLHSTCYGDTRENSIISWYYESIGASSTGGCLRMQVGEMLWIWENCPEGTKLQIVNGSPRGMECERPEKIPDSSMYDPTDPAYLEYLKRLGLM